MTENPLDQRIIDVKFFGPIRGIIGMGEDKLAVPSKVSVIEVIRLLCEKYGQKFEDIALIGNNELNSGLIVFVNGKHVTDPSHEILPEEEVQLMLAAQMKGG
jgi:molybdopterin converting factor small subunit